MRTSHWPLVTTLLLCVMAVPAPAQQGGRPLNASGTRSLTFGTIFPGLPGTVLRTDAARAGAFQITGQKNTDVRITFTLPAALSVGGLVVPLAFAAGDGGVSTSGTIGTATAFDPRVPLTARLSGQGRLYLYLGASALPAGQAAAGAYAADITISVCYVGDPSC